MMAIAAAFCAVFVLGLTLGFIAASLFCAHMREIDPIRRRLPAVPPAPQIVPDAAPAEFDIERIFRESGLERIGGRWVSPNAPYLKGTG